MPTALHFIWKGTFKTPEGPRTMKLEFDAENEDSAGKIIREYVETKNAKGWVLVSNNIAITRKP